MFWEGSLLAGYVGKTELTGNVLLKLWTIVTLEHKTSHKGQFFEIEMYASSESWINSFPLMYGLLW